MSQAALRVPLGFAPRAPQGSALGWESVWIEKKSDADENGVENDAWDEDGDETTPHASCTASYYLAQAPGTGAGEVYIAVGYSDGTVRVFAAPVDKNTPPPQSDVHERPARHAHGHRRSSRTTLPGSTSPYSPSSASIWPPMSDVTPWDATTKTSASTASSSISPSSPTHTSVSDGPTQSMSQDVAQFTPKHENAEALLEAQYHATASPCVIAHSGDARPSHVHEHHDAPKHREHHDAPKHRDRLHSLWERRPSGGMSDPAPLSDAPSEAPSVEPVVDTHLVRAPLPVRSLYTPDASRVTALLVDDRPNDAVLPAQLLVQQDSGRVTAWSLPLLQFLGTAQLRVMQHSAPGAEHEVQFVFERQATELGSQLLQPVDAYMHMARLTPCAEPTLVLHPLPVLGSSEQLPLLIWAEYKEWPSRIFVLRTDPVRSTLAVCAVLHAPDIVQRTLCLSLEGKPHLLLYAAGDELVRETYALGDWAQFCQGLSMPAPRPAPNGAPSGTSTPVHAPPGRLSLKHLGLLLPAWTMPKHEPTVSHESSREEMLAPLPGAHKKRLTELVTSAHTTPEASQRALAEATVLAAAVVGSTCALALHASESALLLVDGELEQPYLHLLPSRPISLLPMERTGSLGVLCQVRVPTHPAPLRVSPDPTHGPHPVHGRGHRRAAQFARCGRCRLAPVCSAGRHEAGRHAHGAVGSAPAEPDQGDPCRMYVSMLTQPLAWFLCPSRISLAIRRWRPHSHCRGTPR